MYEEIKRLYHMTKIRREHVLVVCEEYQTLSRAYGEREHAFLAKVPGEMYREYCDLLEAHLQVTECESEQAFVEGFRQGVRLVIESMQAGAPQEVGQPVEAGA